ncbi:2Fe-2S iron-sulfur cluster-binding protein [Rubrivivax gelatinosus]|uniref:Ferredoxin n=1 Tax=Rubrivivax gelatinosus TaxID=28068 RepID=A0A4R2LS93_RUBGE|nr:2Fe-2S iron-sulfur cluster-binding protein [Rubrivivax gelatinosus]MBK1690079.1 (2Fe-2S)-binding protein [Rubrivivax gelatinosus]TCO96921.1 ferredoxin [Rubrivivax gelatinosus]
MNTNRRVLIVPGGWAIDVPSGSTLLAAALAAGVRLPSSCRNGTCRECRCRVLQGELRHTIGWPGLDADERREGWALPCVAEPLSDLVIEQPRARRDDAA